MILKVPFSIINDLGVGMQKRGRKPISANVIRDIEDISLMMFHNLGGKFPKSSEIYRIHKQHFADSALAESTVRALVARLKSGNIIKTPLYKPQIWIPSPVSSAIIQPIDDIASSEVNELLFQMDRLKILALLKLFSEKDFVRLQNHEAIWAIKIHRSFLQAHEMIKILLILLFSERQVLSYYKDTDPQVGDLNPILMYKPWLGGESFHEYENVLVSGIFEYPKIYFNQKIISKTKSITFSLSGLDALLFAFWAITIEPKTLVSTLFVHPDVHDIQLTPENLLDKFSEFTDEGYMDTPPFLQVISNPLTDIVYKKLRFEDKNWLIDHLTHQY